MGLSNKKKTQKKFVAWTLEDITNAKREIYVNFPEHVLVAAAKKRQQKFCLKVSASMGNRSSNRRRCSTEKNDEFPLHYKFHLWLDARHFI